ncbi:MAG: Molybdate-binding periplasmic protein [Pseudomonadota bacterium]|jgi:molybdate transport system substrate-binding protein
MAVAEIASRTSALLFALAASLAMTGVAIAGETKVAVAANFTAVAKEIGAAFEKATQHKVVFSFGSTGQIYTQITQNAPFEVFLAADQRRPQKLVDEGFAVTGTRFTYATGKLALYSREKEFVAGEHTLRSAKFNKIAIANPVTAPYGAAAVQVMQALAVHDSLKPKIVQGNSISQAYHFVDTGNAEVGFVALSQIALHGEGSRWVVPETLYRPIAQDAVLLKRGANNEAAKAFIAFLQGVEARKVKEKYGYGTGQ